MSEQVLTRESAIGPAAHESDSSGLTRLTWMLVSAVTFTGVLLTAVGVWDLGKQDLTALVVLALMAAAADRFDFSLYGNINISLAFVPIFAACILGGMSDPALAVPAAVVASAIGVKRPAYKTAFNFGTLMISGAASVFVLRSFGAASDVGAWPTVLPVVLLAAFANYAANGVLVAAAVSLHSGTSLRAVWSEHCMWLWPHYLVLGILALAIATAYTAMDLWGIAVFIAPPLMMRLSLKQYIDRTTAGVVELREAHSQLELAHVQLQGAHGRLSSAMMSLDEAYDGTLRSLVAALDARDSDTGGHSERVAELTAAIAAEMGISPSSEEGRYIGWGALLHDVGKVAIPDHILRKPDKLSDEEWETMRTHAEVGFEIVKNVNFLAPAAEIVLAHHERYDGRGYPRGLAKTDIPLGARIFMIADTFDAITSARPYKASIPPEEALAEILRCSSTQFDPACVRAFLSVYRKRFVETAADTPDESGSSTPRPLSESLKKAISEAIAKAEAQ